MKKRTAIIIAGGLISSMMAGVVSLTIGRGIVGASAAGVAPKPIVRTVTTVVTVKKRRPANSGPVKTITVTRPGSSSINWDEVDDAHDDRGHRSDG